MVQYTIPYLNDTLMFRTKSINSWPAIVIDTFAYLSSIEERLQRERAQESVKDWHFTNFNMPPVNRQVVLDNVRAPKFCYPTTSQALLLLYHILNAPKDRATKRFKCLFRYYQVLTCTENFYAPDGVFTYDNQTGTINIEEILAQQDELALKDVRFVRYGFKTGYLAHDEFMSNPFVIAQLSRDSLTEIMQLANEIQRTYSIILPHANITKTTAVKCCTKLSLYSDEEHIQLVCRDKL